MTSYVLQCNFHKHYMSSIGNFWQFSNRTDWKDHSGLLHRKRQNLVRVQCNRLELHKENMCWQEKLWPSLTAGKKSVDYSLLNLVKSRCPERGQFTKKNAWVVTYFFEKHIPLGIQKRPNENIRCGLVKNFYFSVLGYVVKR